MKSFYGEEAYAGKTVIVDNSMTPNSRWYSGSGIYRDMNIYVGEKEHVVPDGIRVTTVSYQPAVIKIEVESTEQKAQDGFQVNGKAVKLKGGCIHHDNGPLGACSVYKAEYRRVKKLKELGFFVNNGDTTYNPHLDICNKEIKVTGSWTYSSMI